ncbi:CRISPR-associated endonuclease Cas1 [Persephonella sp.]
MKEIFFITKQGSKIRRKDNQIAVYLDEEKITGIPINRIESLFIFGNIEISTPALNFLLSRNADIFLLSSTGKFKGMVSSTHLRSNNNNRLRQYRAYFNEKKNLYICKFFVRKKAEEIRRFIDKEITEYIEKIEKAESYNEILGIEGILSQLFFENFKEFIKDKNLGFEGRKYNPPPDPVNSLLSLAYTLIYNLLFSVVVSKGFDPYLGFLHKKRGTHAAFVSDIMEPFRIDITRFVGILFNEDLITPDDFNPDINTYYLKDNSLKKFLKIFNENYLEKDFLKEKIEKLIKELEGVL